MDQLEALRIRYAHLPDEQSIWDALIRLARHFSEASVIDAAAAAFALNAILNNSDIPLHELSPQMREAFALSYPHVDLIELAKGPPSEMQGFMNAWRGKLFEVTVRDRLNQGESVAGLHLGPGETARLAADATQPGWDLEILSAKGESVAQIQLKATDSLAYVQEHFARYPGISVIATSELAGHEHLTSLHPALDISDAHLTHQVQVAADHLHAPQHDDWLAGLPWVLIAATEAWSVLRGQKTGEQALAHAATRGVRTAGWLLVGKVVSLVSPILALGVLAGRVLFGLASSSDTHKSEPSDRTDVIRIQIESFVTVPNRLLPKYSGDC